MQLSFGPAAMWAERTDVTGSGIGSRLIRGAAGRRHRDGFHQQGIVRAEPVPGSTGERPGQGHRQGQDAPDQCLALCRYPKGREKAAECAIVYRRQLLGPLRLVTVALHGCGRY